MKPSGNFIFLVLIAGAIATLADRAGGRDGTATACGPWTGTARHAFYYDLETYRPFGPGDEPEILVGDLVVERQGDFLNSRWRHADLVIEERYFRGLFVTYFKVTNRRREITFEATYEYREDLERLIPRLFGSDDAFGVDRDLKLSVEETLRTLDLEGRPRGDAAKRDWRLLARRIGQPESVAFRGGKAPSFSLELVGTVVTEGRWPPETSRIIRTHLAPCRGEEIYLGVSSTEAFVSGDARPLTVHRLDFKADFN